MRHFRYLPAEHLEAVARVYSAALALGQSPVAAVAQAFGIPVSTAAHRVRAARKRGYLPPTTPGVPRGNGGAR